MPTYEAIFDPRLLPAWARQHAAVVERCRRDLAYRCDVCMAKTPTVRKALIRLAEGDRWTPKTL